MHDRAWVVVGECGKYSDRQWWVVLVAPSESEAQAFCDRINAEIDQVWGPEDRHVERRFRDGGSLADHPDIEARIRALDPEFDDSYYGPARYSFADVPITSPLARSAPHA